MEFFVVLFGIAFVLSLVRAFEAFFPLDPARKLSPVDTRSVAELEPDQTVRVVGEVRSAGQDLLVAPLSGRQCVYYEVIVEVDRHGEKVKSHRDAAGQSFLLEEGEARVLVNLERGVTPVLVADYRDQVGWLDQPYGRLGVYLRDRGIMKEEFHGLRLREGILEEGERVSVRGWCHQERDGSAPAGYRTQPKRLMISCSGALLVYDDPRTVAKHSKQTSGK